MNRIRIDIVSDVACPWCAIGDAYLQQARERLGDEWLFDVHWHPFVLNPNLPAEGRDLFANLVAKYGKPEAEIRDSQQKIIETAHAAGLNFEHAAERRAWNTFDTHRVLAYAAEYGCDQAFHRALFEAYFGAAQNPTDPGVLRSIGTALGLDANAIQSVFDSDDYTEVVQADIEQFQRAGVTAVPAFLIDKRYLISGAQPPHVLVDALQRNAGQAAECV